MTLRVSDREGERAMREVSYPSFAARMHDDLWTTHLRPDGSTAVVMLDAEGEAWVVVEPCSTPRLMWLDEQVMAAEREGTGLTLTPVSWEPL